MDTEKQRYCVEKRFWKTRGIGWSNMLKENMTDSVCRKDGPGQEAPKLQTGGHLQTP